MHIVYLVCADIQGSSGGMRVIFEHVNRLHRLKHETEIWVPAGYSTTPYFKSLVPIKQFKPSQLNDPQIVVITDPAFLAQVTPVRKTKPTFLFLQHDTEMVFDAAGAYNYAKEIGNYKQLFQEGSYQMLVVSSWVGETVKARYGLQSTLIRNGIDTKLFRPDKPLIAHDKPFILTMYDPQQWKGFNEAALGILEARGQFPDIRIGIIGRSFPETPKTPNMYYGFPFPVLFFNRPEQEDLRKIYSSATVFVSTPWQEGFGLPVLEAMACGVPVVTTNAGGNSDFVLHEETVLVAETNPESIKRSIVRLLEDAELRKKLSANARQKTKEFTWGSSIKALVRIFSETLK